MASVIAMLHGGVRCAVPAQQVKLADAGQASAHRASLWPAHTAGRRAPAQQHSLCLSVGGGTAWIGCSRPRLVELNPERVWPLSELLTGLLDMPYIVGVAEIQGALHWIIDAHRLTAVTEHG